MDKKQWIESFWRVAIAQNDTALRTFFAPSAIIRWHNTNEKFTVDEYIIANCEYPGDWQGEVERIVSVGDLTITVANVWLADRSASFHVTSFFEFQTENIIALDEYWSDDGSAPQWRQDKRIGKPIK